MQGFRPLDGESFSKLDGQKGNYYEELWWGFRPLDGESFSKRDFMMSLKMTEN